MSEKFITASTKKIIRKNISKTSSSCYIIHITLIINRDVAHHIAFFLTRAMPHVLCHHIHVYHYMTMYIWVIHQDRELHYYMHKWYSTSWKSEANLKKCVCCCYTYKNVSAAHAILNVPISLSLQKEKGVASRVWRPILKLFEIFFQFNCHYLQI